MKLVITTLLTLFLTTFSIACSEEKAPTQPESTAFGGGEAIQSDDYGTLRELDKKRMGDRDVTLYVNEWRTGEDKDIKEPVLRVYISGAEPEKRVVRAWLADANGNALTPRAAGEWRSSDGSFLCKLDFKEKATSKGACKLIVRVDEAEDSWDVTIN